MGRDLRSRLSLLSLQPDREPRPQDVPGIFQQGSDGVFGVGVGLTHCLCISTLRAVP